MRSALKKITYAWKVLRHKQFADGGTLPKSSEMATPITDGNGYLYYKGKWYKFTQDLMEEVE